LGREWEAKARIKGEKLGAWRFGGGREGGNSGVPTEALGVRKEKKHLQKNKREINK